MWLPNEAAHHRNTKSLFREPKVSHRYGTQKNWSVQEGENGYELNCFPLLRTLPPVNGAEESVRFGALSFEMSISPDSCGAALCAACTGIASSRPGACFGTPPQTGFEIAVAPSVIVRIIAGNVEIVDSGSDWPRFREETSKNFRLKSVSAAYVAC